ncbi:MAG TPA: MaoC family dehydratase [Thiolinea sp.]|nr:MaoC family dehydratase [Thiolinea sp.]
MSKVVQVGDKAARQRIFTEADVHQFADLTGDHNPVHLDAEFAAGTQFKAQIAHGMLVGSLFTGILGEELPGPGSIYMSQNLSFKAPVYLGQEVTATVEVTSIREGKGIVSLDTYVTDQEGKVLVKGDAVLFVPWMKA